MIRDRFFIMLAALTLTLSTLFLASQAFAQTGARCDCDVDKRLGRCQATVSWEGNRVVLRSSTTQCSMVVWNGNDDPQVTIVTDGEEREQWLGAQRLRTLQVRSCTVCADNATGGGKAATRPGAASAGSFAGTWSGTGRNSFGVRYQESMSLQVNGSEISGVYTSSQVPGLKTRIGGTVTGPNTARIVVYGDGPAEMSATLSGNQLSYRWQWGRGTLTRQ